MQNAKHKMSLNKWGEDTQVQPIHIETQTEAEAQNISKTNHAFFGIATNWTQILHPNILVMLVRNMTSTWWFFATSNECWEKQRLDQCECSALQMGCIWLPKKQRKWAMRVAGLHILVDTLVHMRVAGLLILVHTLVHMRVAGLLIGRRAWQIDATLAAQRGQLGAHLIWQRGDTIFSVCGLACQPAFGHTHFQYYQCTKCKH